MADEEATAARIWIDENEEGNWTIVVLLDNLGFKVGQYFSGWDKLFFQDRATIQQYMSQQKKKKKSKSR